jgi:hypothetical protein
MQRIPLLTATMSKQWYIGWAISHDSCYVHNERKRFIFTNNKTPTKLIK